MNKYRHTYQHGMGLIELLVGIAISLFMLAGIVTVLSTTRQNSIVQSQMSTLQDDQRMAFNMLQMVSQHAGYYPDVVTITTVSALPAVSGTFQVGQYITGTGDNLGVDAASDTLTVRYSTAANKADAMMDCNGSENTTTATVSNVNVFSVNASNELTCKVNSLTSQVLSGGVKSMIISYLVDINNDSSAYQYINATNMTTAYWNQIKAIKIIINFINPLSGQASQASTFQMSRVINVWNKP
jgi:type IV pilus assembly protein PilW